MGTTTVKDAVTNPVKRVVLYLRVSSKRQMDTDADLDSDGNSIDTQRKACHDKARQMGAVIIEEYVEPGNSAQTIEKRPVFRDMMRRIHEQRDVDCVLIYMRSRAFRNYIDAGNTEVALGKLGVKLQSAKEEFGDGAMGEAMKAITDVFNWLQVRLSGEDIKVKMANKARNGGTIGRAKLGYLNEKLLIDGHKVNTVVPDPERAKYIPMAFALFATGQETYESLCRKLTQAGLRMPMTGRYPGGPISKKKIGPLLRDRYYLGYVEYDGIEYPGRHEALVSEELFERVQRVLASHTEGHTRYRTHHHYLKGVVWCGRCQHRFIIQRAEGRHGGEYMYWYCRGRQDGLCDMPSVPVEIMEQAVVAHYAHAVTLPQEWLDKVRAGVDEAVSANSELTDSLRADFQARLTKLDRKEDYYLDLAAEEGWPKDKLRAKLDSIHHEQAELKDTLDRSEQRLDVGREVFYAALALLAQPHEAYERGNETVRAILNKVFFTKLYVDGSKITEHELREPFGAIVDGYRSYRVSHTRTAAQRSTLPQNDTSAASSEGYDADSLGRSSANSTSPSAGHFWSKASRVELRGLEPLTPSLPGPIMALTCGYGEPAGRVAQLAAVECGPVQLNAVGIVAVLQICSTVIGERLSPAGLLRLVAETSSEACVMIRAARAAGSRSGASPSQWAAIVMSIMSLGDVARTCSDASPSV
ncbi:recombinase family protein [Amycolatopsis sp. NBC_01488]|uniref:recombinase family protein n=1 Tax=Amycolatopsis sp. NBC_01488 TaxID=2903563 RepID=UPI002E2C61DD|nr:recombinase family protein [Amycolatopsis sp. NBC_01488]